MKYNMMVWYGMVWLLITLLVLSIETQ